MTHQALSHVRDAFTSYTKAFAALDARAVAEHFHEPALLVTPADVRVLATRADVERAYGSVMAGLPTDYAGTDFARVDVRRLADDLALVVGDGTWRNRAGAGIMPFGMTYTLKKSGDRWLIVAAVIHAANAWREEDDGS